MAAKKEKAASKRAKVSTGKLPDDVKAIKAELNALAARQAALLKKLEKAIEGGAKPQQVQAHLRHKDLKTTMRYYENRDKLIDNASDYIQI